MFIIEYSVSVTSIIRRRKKNRIQKSNPEKRKIFFTIAVFFFSNNIHFTNKNTKIPFHFILLFSVFFFPKPSSIIIFVYFPYFNLKAQTKQKPTTITKNKKKLKFFSFSLIVYITIYIAIFFLQEQKMCSQPAPFDLKKI